MDPYIRSISIEFLMFMIARQRVYTISIVHVKEGRWPPSDSMNNNIEWGEAGWLHSVQYRISYTVPVQYVHTGGFSGERTLLWKL